MTPGGALLRASRMFSLPPALSSSAGDVAAAASRSSDTATAPYPTMQSVTTPQSSRDRGDWGFKRPLPLKSTTKTTTPLIRVKKVDSIEHVTDFASAADHTLSLEKWQEMSVPITMPDSKKRSDSLRNFAVPGVSVFEEKFDVTAFESGMAAQAEDKRWKFRGPWLAGVTEGNFQKYLKRQVRIKRPEFRQFLRERLSVQLSQSAATAALEAGKEVPTPIAAEDITDAQLTEYLRTLRSDRPTLYKMIGEFLDLAPVPPPSSFALSSLGPMAPRDSRPTGPVNPYAEEGPPVTHPSAGLSYLRTASYLDNHPIYGPQKSHPPVKARIIMPRTQHMGSFSAKLGVGGFVADVPQGDTAFQQRSLRGRHADRIPGLNGIDPAIEGGAKTYVQAVSAKVDSQGRVHLKVGEANQEAELVQKELVGEAKVFGQTSQVAEERASHRQMRPRRMGGPTVISSSQSYGLR